MAVWTRENFHRKQWSRAVFPGCILLAKLWMSQVGSVATISNGPGPAATPQETLFNLAGKKYAEIHEAILTGDVDSLSL